MQQSQDSYQEDSASPTSGRLYSAEEMREQDSPHDREAAINADSLASDVAGSRRA